MTLRERLENNKRWAVPILLVVVILAVGYSVWSVSRDELTTPIAQAYFTDDEGKTYFADSVEKVFPFDHGGKQAFRAYVYVCGDSGEPFVGLIGRQVQSEERPPPDPKFKSDARASPIEIKKPGDSKWVAFMSPEGQKLISTLCPQGRPEAVLPGE